ncbi:hypothetical protein T03_9862 [Trichinella britovi]|uniref:Uncharacterized protein n=1 Tax=Trichinella britovi TaxID=45882 RepID=A0A0V0YTH9_TRIBR|nr:hypothetical protein T03_9862 [Trichinella britovi]
MEQTECSDKIERFSSTSSFAIRVEYPAAVELAEVSEISAQVSRRLPF